MLPADRCSPRQTGRCGNRSARWVAVALARVCLAITSLVTGSPVDATPPSPPAPTAVVEPIAAREGPGFRIVGPASGLALAWQAAGALEARAPVRWRVDRDHLRAATAGMVENVVVAGRMLRITLSPGIVAVPMTASDGGAADRRWLLVSRRTEAAETVSPTVEVQSRQTSDALASTALPEPAAGPNETVERGTGRAAGLVQAIGTATGAELRLDWPPGTSAAVLQRGGQIWIALSHDPGALEMDRATVASALAGLVVGLREVPADRGRVLQLRLERAVGLAVRREGDTWVVALTRAPSPPPRSAPLSAQASGIALAGAEMVIAAADEATGDQLFFAPLREAPLGLPRPIRLPDADLLATAQGIAWRARSDRASTPLVDAAGRALLPVAVGPTTTDRLAQGLLAAHEAAQAAPATADATARSDAGYDQRGDTRSMPVSPGEARAPLQKAEEAVVAGHGAEQRRHQAHAANDAGQQIPAVGSETHPSAPLDLPTLAVLNARGVGLTALDDASLAELRRIGQRLATIAAAARAPEERTRARVAWARTLIGADRSAEAMGLLELERNDADAQGLASVAALLADLPADAATLLDRARDTDPEIALWRLLLPHDDGVLPAWPASDGVLAVLERYPRALRFAVARRLAERAIEDGRGEFALQLRDLLERSPLSPRQRAVTAWLTGTVLGREGDLAAAREQLRIAARTGDPSIRAAADAELTRAEREAGAISAATALERLAAQRSHWRGLPNEGVLLVRLGEEAERADRPLEALIAWRDALGHGLAAGPARRLSQRLQAVFLANLEALTAAARAAPTNALEAVALLDRFPELVPPGQPGAELRGAVARSLVPVGLPRLALRLAEPVGRVEPVVGAMEEAEWHLAADEPLRAITALERPAATTPPADPARLAALRARARLMLGDPSAALQELAGLARSDPAVEALRREALWRLDDRSGFVAANDLSRGPPASELDRLRLATIAFAAGDQQRARDLLADPPDEGPGDPALAPLRDALAMPVPSASSVRELLPTSDAAQQQARVLAATASDDAGSVRADPRSPDRG